MRHPRSGMRGGAHSQVGAGQGPDPEAEVPEASHAPGASSSPHHGALQTPQLR